MNSTKIFNFLREVVIESFSNNKKKELLGVIDNLENEDRKNVVDEVVNKVNI